MQDIRSVGVLGAGQMGRGIAQVAATHGVPVKLADIDLESAAKGRETIGRSLDRAVSKGKLAAADAAAIIERIEPVADVSGFAAVDLAIEAATESIDLKLRLMTALDGACADSAILATNTSSISITKLAAATSRPESVIGMHFMNPVPVMELVEVIRGLATKDEVHGLVCRTAEAWGKTVVTSRDRPGFLVNRVLIPLINEACFALQEGVGSAEDIDTGARLGLNHPMGPLALADLIGLDTCLAIAEVLHREIGDDKYRPASIMRNHVAAGWLGRKSGRGFYEYSGARR